VGDQGRIARVVQASGKPPATSGRFSISRSTNTPASDDSEPPSKQAFKERPPLARGDRPGSGNVGWSMAGAASVKRNGLVSAPNSKLLQRSGLHPPPHSKSPGIARWQIS